jgi:predicted TPR repeat methyltransferase
MSRDPDDVIKEYKAMAAGYDQGSSDSQWAAPTFVANNLRGRGLLTPQTRIVDFAAGTGLLSSSLRATIGSQAMHITALDISPDMLAELKTKHIADLLRTQDITKPWNVPRQSFDIAAGTGVGEYLTDHQLQLTVRNVATALKKGGHAAFTYEPLNRTNTNQELHDPQAVATMFRKAGFQVIEDKEFPAYASNQGNSINHRYILAKKL